MKSNDYVLNALDTYVRAYYQRPYGLSLLPLKERELFFSRSYSSFFANEIMDNLYLDKRQIPVSLKIAEIRDLYNDWQCKNEVFVYAYDVATDLMDYVEAYVFNKHKEVYI